MKTHAKQPNNSTPEKAPGSNQAPTGSILQAYKTSGNQPIAQLRAYSQTFTVQQDINDNDLHDWGTMRQKLGIPKKGSAAGAAGSNAKTSLTALGIAGTDSPMTAHMIPRRAGGMGNSTNARPWADKFETTTWKNSIDDVFDGEFKNKKKNDTVTYAINTTDMDDTYYNSLLAKSTAATAVKNDAAHKSNIKEIPVDVSATVGSKSLATTTDCIKDLIK
ncbi:hypothetical protein [Fluviicola sp.]|uniref:hypothetical protein n=1 Tax=Fluviicola sp. TaxID=1917219 RepID=UPI0031E21034